MFVSGIRIHVFVIAYIGTGQIMGWGSKAIEIRSLETGSLEGVFMHKRTQRLKFLCERNDKVCLMALQTGLVTHCLGNSCRYSLLPSEVALILRCISWLSIEEFQEHK